MTVGATHSTGCSQRSASLRMPLQKVKCQALSVLSPSMRTCADPSSGYASKSRAATDGHTPLQLGPRANLGACGEESSGEAIAAAIEEVSWPEPPNAAAAPTHATSARAPYLVARCFVRVVSKRFIRSAVTPRSGVFASAGLTATGANDDSRVFISCRVSSAVPRVRSAPLSRVPSLCDWPSAEPRELHFRALLSTGVK